MTAPLIGEAHKRFIAPALSIWGLKGKMLVRPGPLGMDRRAWLLRYYATRLLYFVLHYCIQLQITTLSKTLTKTFTKIFNFRMAEL